MENRVSECSEILHTSFRPTPTSNWALISKSYFQKLSCKKKPQWSPFKLSNDTKTWFIPMINSSRNVFLCSITECLTYEINKRGKQQSCVFSSPLFESVDGAKLIKNKFNQLKLATFSFLCKR
jgi:hypothetical protein